VRDARQLACQMQAELRTKHVGAYAKPLAKAWTLFARWVAFQKKKILLGFGIGMTDMTDVRQLSSHTALASLNVHTRAIFNAL